MSSRRFWMIWCGGLLCFSTCAKQSRFIEVIIDNQGPQYCNSKAVGDLDGDEKMDMIVGGSESGGLVWYENTTFNKHVINFKPGCKSDADVADIDHDGDQDIVQLYDQELVWIENPEWTIHPIDTVNLHDIECADFNRDNLIDIVGRGQAESCYGGDTLFFYMQILPDEWMHFKLTVPEGEGLKAADLNADTKPDIILNGYWLENAGQKRHWLLHPFVGKWLWSNTCIDAGDLNMDGCADILLSPSEKSGQIYRIAWFEAPKNPVMIWKEHVIESKVEAVLHSVRIADFNGDGMNDFVTAEMQQGKDPDKVIVYYRQHYNQWEKEVISINGSHNLCLLDVDSDGDMDIFGANWQENIVKVWKNENN
jgi:hypothetical protein